VGVRIAGTGSFAPEKVLHNKDLERMVDTTDEWIYERTGIRERRVLDSKRGTVEMAFRASTRALKSARMEPDDIELIVMGTVSPDYYMPSGACMLQNKLKVKNSVAFDVAAACSGFIYALVVADALIAGGHFKNALVVGADALTKFTDYKDRSTCILFGDGAGAVVVERGDKKSGLIAWRLYSDGSHWDKLCIPGGGSLNPPSSRTVKNRMHYIKMSGRDIFKIAVTCMEEVALQVLEDAGLSIQDVSLFIPHQANIRIIENVRERLGLSHERVFLNLGKYGNTSAGSIPLALDEAARNGRVKRGDNILFTSFGAGLTWGAALLRW
jgi:3-oxoacyl-[acyl-carrier-protein] synthase-3